MSASSASYSASSEFVPTVTEKDKNNLKDFKNLKVNDYTLEFYNILSPVKSGDKLYFTASGDKDNKGNVNLLVEYDLKTGRYKEIYRSKFDEAAVQCVSCNDDFITWADMNSFGSATVLCAMNRSSGEIIKLNSAEFDELSLTVPVLDGDYVAWVENYSLKNNKIKSKVNLYNLKTREKKVVGNIEDSGLHNEFTGFDKGKLIWTDKKDGKSSYFVYDVNSGKTEVHKTKNPNLGYPVLSGNLIFAKNYPDMERDASELCMLNIETGREINDKKFINADYFRAGKNYFVMSSGGNVNVYRIMENDIKLIDVYGLKTEPGFTVCEDDTLILIGKNQKKTGYSRVSIVDLAGLK